LRNALGMVVSNATGIRDAPPDAKISNSDPNNEARV
jgi:hypothetical protein